jgi:hypothetical protein
MQAFLTFALMLIVQATPPASSNQERTAGPCDAPEYRQLDFWLGEWEARGVKAPPTKPPASSVITKVHAGCVILETWKSDQYTGQSFNIYDRTRRQWHQTWVDSSGGLQQYWGRLHDGNMVYEGTVAAAPGKPSVQTRMTFFNLGPGRVRQLIEHSADGKTWEMQYDFAYTRKP